MLSLSLTQSCSRCRRFLPRSNFYPYSKYRCKDCHHAACKASQKRNPDSKVRGYLKFHYGLSLEKYRELSSRQGDVCALCRRPPVGRFDAKPRLHVDHCHKTGKIRGLLCHNCNAGLGNLRDSAEMLRLAADYLDRDGCLSENLTIDPSPLAVEWRHIHGR